MSALKKPPSYGKEVKPAKKAKPKYILHLYVSGILQNSVHAIKNINHICETYLKDSYELEVFDINQLPVLLVKEQIVLIPVLIIKKPLPEQRIIGDLSNTDKILEALNI